MYLLLISIERILSVLKNKIFILMTSVKSVFISLFKNHKGKNSFPDREVLKVAKRLYNFLHLF